MQENMPLSLAVAFRYDTIDNLSEATINQAEKNKCVSALFTTNKNVTEKINWHPGWVMFAFGSDQLSVGSHQV